MKNKADRYKNQGFTGTVNIFLAKLVPKAIQPCLNILSDI